MGKVKLKQGAASAFALRMDANYNCLRALRRPREGEMASSNVDDQVRRAWQQQRAGDSRAAVDAFAQIVKSHPDDIDARYGLGLSLKSAGNPDEAISSFRSALQLVEEGQRVEGEKQTSGEDDRLRSPEDDRLIMLSLMLTQRIGEIEGGG